MQTVHKEMLINNCTEEQERFVSQRLEEINIAIANVKNPPDADTFIINPTRHGNGVVPIKRNFIKTLIHFGWLPEFPMSFVSGVNPGPLDAFYQRDTMNFAVEWETGNISSSHRAMSKLLLGLKNHNIIGGTLVLPSKNLYPYLTDRIGNYDELCPYFPVWKQENVSGFLAVVVVEHDQEDVNVATIPKGTDGRALR